MDAWPILVQYANTNSINFLNGSYMADEAEDPIIVSKNARHMVVWTQNPTCMFPDKVEQFVEFCKYYSAKLINIPPDQAAQLNEFFTSATLLHVL